MIRYEPATYDLLGVVGRLRLVVFDFDGVFTDNNVYVFEDGREAVRCSRFDGFGLQRLERAGIKPFILSTETNPVVTARAAKLKVDCRQSCDDKPAALKELLAVRSLSFAEVAYVGNDVNDVGCLQLVALPIVVADAHPDVMPYARHTTIRQGGQGAVREICDWLAEIREATAPPAQEGFSMTEEKRA